MSYRTDVPVESHDVRGVSGDLVAMRANFGILEPVVLSGINALISGGANVSGAVPVAQSSAPNALWFARRLTSADIDGFNVSGMRVSGILQWDGDSLEPGIVISGTFVSGQYAKNTGTDRLVPGIRIIEAGIATSGTLQWDGAKLVPGVPITGPFSTNSYPKWTGAALASGVTIDESSDIISGIMQWDGDKLVNGGLIISGAFAANQYAEWSGTKFVPGVIIDEAGIATDGLLRWDGTKFIAGFAASVAGITSGQTLLWSTAQSKFLPGNPISGAGVSTATPPGEYICHLAYASGVAGQSITTATTTLVTGCSTARRNVGGFTTGNGTVTLPTGSGYTHAIARGRIEISGAGSNSGYRAILIQVSGGAQDAGVDSGNYTYSGIPWASLSGQVAAVTSSASTALMFESPLLPISGGEKFSIYVRHDQGANLGLAVGANGNGVYLQVQAYKLLSGGTD